MCAICAIFGADNEDSAKFLEGFMKLKHRGPHVFRVENNDMDKTGILGYHRLEVKSQFDETIMQPLQQGPVKLICNGDIYNWREIASQCNDPVKCDVQVITTMYIKYWRDLEALGAKLDGVFAFCLIDSERKRIIIGRDRYGVRPLYKLIDPLGLLAISSEEQGLQPLLDGKPHRKVVQFPPGTIEMYSLRADGLTNFEESVHFPLANFENFEISLESVRTAFKNAVNKMTKVDPTKLGVILTSGMRAKHILAVMKSQDWTKSKLQLFCDVTTMTSDELNSCRALAEKHSHAFKYTEINSNLPHKTHATKSEGSNETSTEVETYESIMSTSKYINKHTEIAIVLTDCGAKHLSTSEDLAKDGFSSEIELHDRPTASQGLEIRTPFLDFNFVQQFKMLARARKDSMTSAQLFAEVFDGFLYK